MTPLEAAPPSPPPPPLFPVGRFPQGITWDGANIWVSNFYDYTVTKLRGTDGSNLGTFGTGQSFPYDLDTDRAAVVWVLNYGGPSITRLRVSDGGVIDIVPIPDIHPKSIFYDGSRLWITNTDTNIVRALRSSDLTTVCTYAAASPGPTGKAFDGTHVWIADAGGLRKVRASDCVEAAGSPFAIAGNPLAFDGTYVWLVGPGNAVSKLRPSDGAVVASFPVSYVPTSLATDGTVVSVTHYADNRVTQLNARNGKIQQTISIGNGPANITLGGGYAWLVLQLSDAVSRISAP